MTKIKIFLVCFLLIYTNRVFSQNSYSFPLGSNYSINNITSAYGPRNLGSANYPDENYNYDFHAAIDIGALIGTNVYSVLDGTIAEINNSNDDNERIIVEYSDSYGTFFICYFHIECNSNLSKGDDVYAGSTVLGTIRDFSYGGDHLDIRYIDVPTVDEINQVTWSNSLNPGEFLTNDYYSHFSNDPILLNEDEEELTNSFLPSIMEDTETNYSNQQGEFFKIGARVRRVEVDLDWMYVFMSAWDSNDRFYTELDLLLPSGLEGEDNRNVVEYEARINCGDTQSNNDDVGHNSQSVGIYPRELGSSDTYHSVYFRWYINENIWYNMNEINLEVGIQDIYGIVNDESAVIVNSISLPTCIDCSPPDNAPNSPTLLSANYSTVQDATYLEWSSAQTGDAAEYFKIYRCPSNRSMTNNDAIGISQAMVQNSNNYYFYDNTAGNIPGQEYKYAVAGVNYEGEGLNSNELLETFGELLPAIISSNATLDGHYYSNGTTVNSNVIVTVQDGVDFVFENNSSMIVNGILDIAGVSSNKVTFDFVSQNTTTKNGIKINHGGSANINNALIKNAYNGVYVDEGVIDIDNSEIFNCYYGIHLYRTNYVSYPSSYITNTYSHDNEFGVVMYYSTAHLSNNEFSNNWIGIGCADYSSPYLAPNDNDSESMGYNYIHGNDIGVYAYGYSNPFLGRETCVSFGGNNNISNNNYYEFYTRTNCNISAEKNYWGGGVPVRYVESSCTFDYTPYLTSPPQQSQSVVVTPEEEIFDSQLMQQQGKASTTLDVLSLSNSSIPSGFNTSWPIEWKLLYARNLMRVKKYNSASKICEDVITDCPDSSLSYLALDLLHQSRVKGKNKTSFTNFVKEKANKKVKKQIYGTAELLLAVGEKKDRVAVLNKIAEKYKNTPVVEFVLFQKFMYYLYEENNLELAKTTSGELGKLFPNSESYFDSQRHLGNDVKTRFEPQLVKEASTDETLTFPKNYELHGNYPNPFNPSTTISYSLAYDSNVEITIYDITGKAVKVFSENVQSAGYRNIVWNGNNQQGAKVSSGIYFYRFKASSLENETVFEKTAKMLLLK